VANRAIQVHAGGGTKGRGDDVVAQVANGTRGGVAGEHILAAEKAAAGEVCAIPVIERGQVVDAELEAIAKGELADDGGKVHLGRLAIELVEQAVDLVDRVLAPHDQNGVGHRIGDHAGL